MQQPQLEIHRPILSKRITQGWGENKACKDLKTGKIKSANSLGVCPNGSVLFYPSVGLKGHNGFDNEAIHGELVYHAATFPGVMYVEKDRDGGIGVDVVSKKPLWFPGPVPPGVTPVYEDEHGFTAFVKIRYWHLLTAIGYDKKEIVYGQPIGRADNTGASSGDHLHWAPKWSDPESFGMATDNGFQGAFDPTPYYNHEIFAGEPKPAGSPPVPVMTPEEKREDKLLSLQWRVVLLLQQLIHRLTK